MLYIYINIYIYIYIYIYKSKYTLQQTDQHGDSSTIYPNIQKDIGLIFDNGFTAFAIIILFVKMLDVL